MRIYTNYLTGPLFAELAANIALEHTEDMPLEPDGKHLTTSFFFFFFFFFFCCLYFFLLILHKLQNTLLKKKKKKKNFTDTY